nr:MULTISPECIES: hypothetical protein [Arsenicicoccus]
MPRAQSLLSGSAAGALLDRVLGDAGEGGLHQLRVPGSGRAARQPGGVFEADPGVQPQSGSEVDGCPGAALCAVEQDRELRLEAVDSVDEWCRLTGHPGGGILVWDVGQLDQGSQAAPAPGRGLPPGQPFPGPDPGLDADAAVDQGGGDVVRSLLVPVDRGEVGQRRPRPDRPDPCRRVG